MARPVLKTLLRARLRRELVADGRPFLQALQLAASVDDEDIQAALDVAPTEVRAGLEAAEAQVAGPGADLLTRLLDFLNSDLGKALVALLKTLLLG